MVALHLEDRIPPALLAQARKLAAPARQGKPISLLNAMKVKLACSSHLPIPEAFEAYAELMGLDDAVGIRTLPLRGLCELLESEGEVLAEIETGGRRFECRAPRIIGPGASPALAATVRHVVAGRIDNAVVHSRSTAILRGDELIMDFQGDELDAIPNELSYDPVILHRSGQRVTYLDDRHSGRLRHLPEAWSLLRFNSVSFGHWMVEPLLQFICAKDLPAFQKVPLLVDEDIPPQHLQSLEAIGGGRFEIIQVRHGERIAVDRLYMALTFHFIPHHATIDQGIDPSPFVAAMDTAARLFAKAGAELDESLGKSTASTEDKLFWARRTDRYRRIDNHEVIEGYIADLGCEKHYPEQLEFSEQVRLIRAAKRIVVQNGSASAGLLLARPGTEVVMLSHPSLPFMALYAELMAQLGIDFSVVTGAFTRKGESYLDRSDYEIPLERLIQVIGHWAE